MWLILAFTSLGLLIGNLVGMTASSVVVPITGLLFAFVGGSAITFLHKIDSHMRILASKAIFSLCFSCFVGVYLGVLVSEYQILSPRTNKSIGIAVRAADYQGKAAAPAGSALERHKYLRSDIEKSNLISSIQNIDDQYVHHHLSPDEAYQKLYSLLVNATTGD